jgi:carbon-monoxide dehydrogenase medium subunit
MRPSAFDYHKAESLDHALALLAEYGEEARPLAGGQSLVPMMNLRLARPSHLVDINNLGLDEIEMAGGLLRIGALVHHERYLTDPLIAAHFPAFREGVTAIGHPTIRCHGTTGGSLSHADPTAELPLLNLLHDATIVASSTGGERRIAAANFFLGAYVTALEPGEMMTAVELPVLPAGSTGAFVELGERRGDFAIAACGVTIEHANGAITRLRLACSGAGEVPVRVPDLERALAGRPLVDPSAVDEIAALVSSLTPSDDHFATADYRRALLGELAGRAIAIACGRATENA